MRTIRTKVYQFNELNDEAKQVAIENNSDINVDYDWWLQTYEDAKTIGLKLTGFDLERNKHATGEFIENACDCAYKIIKNHGVECDSYSLAVGFLAGHDNILNGEEDNESIEELEEEFLKAILNSYADYLQNECDYLQGDEAIKETLVSNEYEFTKDGNMFNS